MTPHDETNRDSHGRSVAREPERSPRAHPSWPDDSSLIATLITVVVIACILLAANLLTPARLVLNLSTTQALAIGLIATLGLVWMIIAIPKMQTARLNGNGGRQVELENAARTTLVQIIGGGLILVTAWSTINSLQIAQENLQLARTGQLTDRFSKAVDQLTAAPDRDGGQTAPGSGQLLIKRLGGAYALHGIAQESRAYRRPVVEVLTAYVRDRQYMPDPEKPKTHPPDPVLDVREIIRLLGRQAWVVEGSADPMNLQHINLAGVVAPGGHFERADFGYARLVQARLSQAHLESARLENVNAEGVVLEGAHLENASLVGAKLPDANLMGAHLAGADLSAADLRGANLARATGLTKVEGAIYDGSTTWPEGFNAQAHGAKPGPPREKPHAQIKQN